MKEEIIDPWFYSNVKDNGSNGPGTNAVVKFEKKNEVRKNCKSNERQASRKHRFAGHSMLLPNAKN